VLLQTVKTIFGVLDNRTITFVIWVCVISAIFIILTSLFIGSIRMLEPLLILPIIVLSWYGGKSAGFTLAALIVSTTLLIDTVALVYPFYSLDTVIHVVSRIIAYFLTAVLVINFRNVHNEEFAMASTDNLTGLLNSRSFSVELANEIFRSIRYKHIFSLSYIDIDNFKEVNDTFGHQEGDKLLNVVSKCLTSSLRKTDIIARLGGDEFAVIFPETGQQEVKKAFAKAKKSLDNRMKSKKWNVTFSVGIVTFEHLPVDVKEAINIADELMYSVKNHKKNDVAFQVWQGIKL